MGYVRKKSTFNSKQFGHFSSYVCTDLMFSVQQFSSVTNQICHTLDLPEQSFTPETFPLSLSPPVRCEKKRCGPLGPQVHPEQVHSQPEPPRPTGGLRVAAFSGQEAQPTQGNHGGCFPQQGASGGEKRGPVQGEGKPTH